MRFRKAGYRRKKISAEELHKDIDEIEQVASELGLRSVSDLRIKEPDDSDDSYFYWFSAISTKMRAGRNLDLRKN